jgi:hypothetical protein
MIRFPNTAAVGIDCLSYASGSRFNGKNFTIAAFVKRMGAGTTVSCGTNGLTAIEPIFTHGIGETETIGQNIGWFLGYVPSVNRYGVDFEDTNNGLNHPYTFSNVINPTTGDVHHVAIVYWTGTDGSGHYSGYVNGILHGSSGFSGAGNIRVPDYGSRQGVGIGIALTTTSGRNGAWNGYIWDCAMWDEPLTSGEVWQLASGKMAYMPLQIRPQNLKSYYPLDEMPDNTVVSTTPLIIRDRVANSGATMFGTATGFANDYLGY